MPEDFSFSKRRIIKAAKELGYSKSVVQNIKEAKSESEMMRIMTSARKSYR